MSSHNLAGSSGATGLPLAVLLAMLAWAASPVSSQAQAGCGAVRVTSPLAGDILAGSVPILGSASIDGFQFYKLEWALQADPEAWSAVSSTIDRPLRNGQLDLWNTAALPDGVYRLKLTAVDQEAGERCRFLVEPLWLANASDPEPTASPGPPPSPTALPRDRANREGGADDASKSDQGSDAGASDEGGSASEVDADSGETSADEGGDDASGDASAGDDSDSDAGEIEREGAAEGEPGDETWNETDPADPSADDSGEGNDEDVRAVEDPDGPAAFLRAMAGSAGRAFGATLLVVLLAALGVALRGRRGKR